MLQLPLYIDHIDLKLFYSLFKRPIIYKDNIA